jgi:hypothetical protein
MVLLDERTGRYWQLNSTGAEILRAVLDGTARGEVAARLAATRDVTAERAAADIAELLDRLAAAGLTEAGAAR